MAAPEPSPFPSPPTPQDAVESLREHVERILAMIRPTIQEDDGDVELVDVTEDGVVCIRFLGACVGCPSSSMTLQVGIEKVLKEHIPQVREVQAVA
jgi:Fe-S cluster biogenesis protein NfuA